MDQAPLCIIFSPDRKWRPVQKKIDTEFDQALKPHGSLQKQTDDIRPSKLSSMTLCSVDHTLSKRCGDPWTVRRALGGGG